MLNMKKQLKLLYGFELFSNMGFAGIIWLVLLVNRGYSLAQVGIAEGIFHLVSFLCEVPSGMMADLLGRKRSMIASNFLRIAGCLCMVLVDSFFGICFSFALNALSYNLTTGTKEALTYDSLLQAGEASRYETISSRQIGIGRVTAALCALFTGVAVLLGWRVAYLLDAALALVCLGFCTLLAEPVVTKEQAARSQHAFAGFGPRFKEHLASSFGFLVHNPKVGGKMLADGAVGCGAYFGGMLLQQQYVELGLAPAMLGVPILLSSLAGAVAAMIAPKLNWNILTTCFACIVGVSIGLVVCGAGLLPLAFLGGMIITGWDGVMEVKMSAHLNEGFPSNQRATLVSTQSLCYSLLMLFASPIAGAICDKLGLNIGLCIMAGVLFAGGATSIGLYRAVRKKAA